MNELIQKILKGLAYASASGIITLGAGHINLVNVDYITIIWLVVASTAFNALREIVSSYLNRQQ